MISRTAYRFPFGRYPAVRMALLLISGILTAHYFKVSVYATLGIFMSLAILLLFAEFLSRKEARLPLSRISVFLFLVMIVAFGAFRESIQQLKEKTPIAALLEVSPWEEVLISGQISSISKTSAGKERWELAVSSTAFGSIESDEIYKARILADEINSSATIGDFVSFTGIIIPINEARNPHDFNYKAFLDSQGILAQIKADSLLELQPNTQKWEWVWWREKAINLANQNFDTTTAPIAKALLLGYKQDLDYEDKTAFARTGLSHIMAVSGLHVGFLVAPFWMIIPLLWTKKYGKQFGMIFLIVLLFSYAGITGFSSSVLRASVMAAFLTYAKLFHKINDSINITAASAVLLLIINPSQLFEIGFQLSYSAVCIILLILPVIQQWLPYHLQIKWYGIPIMSIIVSLVVQFGLYPMQVFYFREISLISPIANALFVPLLVVVIPLSLLAIFVTAVLPLAGYILNFPSLVFLRLMYAFVEYSSELDWAWASASLGSPLIFLIWLFLILAITSYQISALRWRLLIGAFSILCLINISDFIQQIKPANLEVTFFDVGQGDAALLKTPAGKHVLIDAGIWTPGYNSGQYVILPHLKSAGIPKLDAIILSHPHADHIGGILDIISNMDVDVVYNSGYKYDSNLYNNYLELARTLDIPVKTVTAGDTLNIDPAMLFLVMGPDGNIYNRDPNEHSVVLNVIYGESEFLFTGDAGEDQEHRILKQYGSLLDTDLLKVGHHGSRTSSGLSFLQAVTPEIAVISLAESNRFRHPHPEAISRLAQSDAELLFTAKEKAIIFESDGKRINRVYWD